MNISLNPIYIYMYREHNINGNKARISHLLLEIRCTVTSVFKTFWLCLNSMSQTINWVLFNISSIHEIESDIFLLLTGDSQFFNNKIKIRKKKRKHAQGNKNDFFSLHENEYTVVPLRNRVLSYLFIFIVCLLVNRYSA